MTLSHRNFRRLPWVPAALLGVAGLTSVATSNVDAQSPARGHHVVLTAPMFACLTKTDGTQPPEAPKSDGKKAADREEEVFFVIAGKDGRNRPVVVRSPSDGHLMVDSTGLKRIHKNLTLWQGTLEDGEHATLVVNVRERDAGDSAESDIEEAREIAAAIDNAKPLEAAVRVHAGHILAGGEGGKGENDHVGSIAVRVACEGGRIRMLALPDENSYDLKGHDKNHPTRRAFGLDGHHGDFRLVVEATEKPAVR